MSSAVVPSIVMSKFRIIVDQAMLGLGVAENILLGGFEVQFASNQVNASAVVLVFPHTFDPLINPNISSIINILILRGDRLFVELNSRVEKTLCAFYFGYIR